MSKKSAESEKAEDESRTAVNPKPEEKVMQLLLAHKLHITFVESCTGGMLAARLINVSGASGVIEQSFITYSNKAKHILAGVKKSTLKKHGAVSRQTAKEMAEGGAKRAKCEVAVSVTGVAGPGTEEDKPAGLVYIGIFYKGKTKTIECNLEGDRQQVREMAVQRALKLIADEISAHSENK